MKERVKGVLMNDNYEGFSQILFLLFLMLQLYRGNASGSARTVSTAEAK